MAIPMPLPGFERRKLVLEPGSLLSILSPRLTLDGATVEPGRGLRYVLQDDQGREVRIRLKPRRFDPAPDVEIGEETISLAPPFRWYEHAWMGWPLLFYIDGGMIGGAFGIYMYWRNMVVFRGQRGTLAKYLIVLAASAGALALVSVWALLVRVVVGAVMSADALLHG